MRFVSDKVITDEPSALVNYYDKTFESWPAETRPIQLLFNCFLSFIEADLSAHSGKPDKSHHIRDASCTKY